MDWEEDLSPSLVSNLSSSFSLSALKMTAGLCEVKAFPKWDFLFSFSLSELGAFDV